MVHSDIKILGVGAAILDVLAHVDDVFLKEIGGEKGGMNLLPSPALADELIGKLNNPVRAIGGSAANTIFGLQNLDMKTALLAKVGKDAEGDFYIKEYKKNGGDSTRFKRSDTLRTGRCISLITPDSERTMRTDLGASGDYRTADILPSDFAGIDHVHIEGYFMFYQEAFLQVLKLAKEAGATISLDLASFEVVRIFRSGLEDLLTRYVDIVFANEDEARELMGGELDPSAATAKLNECCDIAVVKLGKKGACIRNRNSSVTVPASLVSAIDTTGAGDLWQAGFLYGYLNGYSMEIAGKMGSLLGAEVVQIIGASIPPFRWGPIKSNFKQLAKE